ncbi:GDSL-type esterase/lipase family protein [Actinoplanes sp. NEAU-A12]|uniref:GDSL-type esterase/lipase family protein n=1 Tax=Actinoplanes sandaracinus TaxID=3045177 RepID=A0ABT6WR50_9ACTN|nr:GDSL-type esterase/lipase family protein [Actinoplanes sandaracinus]MDI6102179.1 GDSL-type esterase/lipase family protein [Actinoplanes sandaracinus]
MRWVAVPAVLLAAGCSSPAPSPRPSSPPSPRPSAQPAPPWTGTWATAVEGGGRSFEAQTLRQIVHTSIGGDIARIRLTNEFGENPLVVASVRMALPVDGVTIDPATDRQVTFAGATSVTIPPGAAAESDDLAFPVPADGDVAVSVHLPTATGPSTRHGIAVRDNYTAPGDQTSARRLTGAAKETSWYFLAGLDVRGGEGAVVAFGASITDGLGSRFGADQRWPDLLADRLRAAGRTVGVLNAGISGNRLTVDDRGQSAANRFERDVLRQPGARWVIISDDALNDLGAADPPAPAELIAVIRALIERAHGAGIRVICSTLTPYAGAGYWTTRGETGRIAINTFVRSDGSGCDAVLDQDKATRDPADPARYLPEHDSGDHLHPSAEGLRAIADAAQMSWFTG